MDYLLFSVVLIATTILGCLILLYSAFKLLLSCPKRNSTRRDLEQGPVPRQEQSKPCHIVEEKNSYFMVNNQDGNTSDSFIEATNETSSLQTSSDSSSNVSTGTQNDSGIHEYEEHKHTDDSRDFNKEELTLNSSFLSLDMSQMFRDADTEIEEDNSDSKLGLSSHLRVEIDINDDLDADFVHMESEDQDSSVTTKHHPECVPYSDSPALSLFGLINKLSYFYCL